MMSMALYTIIYRAHRSLWLAVTKFEDHLYVYAFSTGYFFFFSSNMAINDNLQYTCIA